MVERGNWPRGCGASELQSTSRSSDDGVRQEEEVAVQVHVEVQVLLPVRGQPSSPRRDQGHAALGASSSALSLPLPRAWKVPRWSGVS